MAKSSLMPDEGSYVAFLDDVKTRIRSAQGASRGWGR